MERPKVGVGVIVVKDNKVLLGKRKTDPSVGDWCFPGGHLELNEEIEDCARRETLEETGITIKNTRLGPFTNDIRSDVVNHYVTLYVIAEHESGGPQTTEPDKIGDWKWFSWDALPEPLFLPLKNLLKKGFNPLR